MIMIIAEYTHLDGSLVLVAAIQTAVLKRNVLLALRLAVFLAVPAHDVIAESIAGSPLRSPCTSNAVRQGQEANKKVSLVLLLIR